MDDVLSLSCYRCGGPVRVAYEPFEGLQVNVWTCPHCQKTNTPEINGRILSVEKQPKPH